MFSTTGSAATPTLYMAVGVGVLVGQEGGVNVHTVLEHLLTQWRRGGGAGYSCYASRLFYNINLYTENLYEATAAGASCP